MVLLGMTMEIRFRSIWCPKIYSKKEMKFMLKQFYTDDTILYNLFSDAISKSDCAFC